MIKPVSLNDDLKNNNVKFSTDVPANQELFKNSENKETENNRIKTYKELNCATCKNTPTEENSLGRHNRVTPDRKAWTKLNNPASGAHRNNRIYRNQKDLIYNFACEICNNSMVDKTHPKKHIEKYHRARMKDPEEADNIMIKQRITNSHKITEETEDKGLYGHKNFAPLDSICSNCERNWAPTLNSQHHGNVEHVELLALICDTIPQNNRRFKRHMLQGYSDKEKLTCQSCGNLFDEEKDLRFHITSKYEDDEDKEGNMSPTFMVSITTMICRMIEIHKNKLGPSWAKLRHNWDLML